MALTDEANPVGTAVKDTAISNYVSIMSAEWDKANEVIPWWKIWKKKGFTRVTKFLLGAIDELIMYVDQLNLSGPDKKATVLAAIAILYDYVIREAIPLWARPFAGKIKEYIIYTVISTSIDWIVKKYRDGVWTKKDSTQTAALWSKQAALLLCHKNS